MNKTLYNGIVLPDEWPPRHRDPQSDEPMPVPYLKEPPSVIPIDVGRQLFVDEFLVQETTMEQVFHKPEKYAGNPVLQPETAAEMRFPSVGFQQGGVFYNPEKRGFEMFYHSNHQASRCRHIAVSTDMVHWEPLDTGLDAGNMFLEPGPLFQGYPIEDGGYVFAVWRDDEAQNPAHRYKLVSFMNHARGGTPPQGMTHSLHTSPDGVHWSEPVLAGKAQDAHSFFYNPFRGVWVYSIKRPSKRDGKSLRARWYVESQEFLEGGNWDDAVYWTGADRFDRPEPPDGYPAYPAEGSPCQLYTLHGVAYESIMLGMHEIHRGPHNKICEEGKFPKLTDLEIGFSRDGFHWYRPDRSGFIRATRKEGDWDRGYLHSTTSICVVHEDKLIFPYAGFSGIDPDGSQTGMYRGGAIGMAVLRRDGFASMRAESQEQTLLTRPLRFNGEFLFVNVEAPNGSLTAEVCTEDGNPVPGFSKEDCIPITADTTKTAVRWQGTGSLAQFSGQPVRFRFYVRHGDLYSFWISDSLTGESGGYTGGGGPAFTGSRDIG